MSKLMQRLLLLVILFLSKIALCPAIENESIQPSLRTGFYLQSFPDITLTDMEVALRFWTEEVGKQVGIDASVIIYKNLETMRTDFYQGKINFIVASPLVITKNFDQEQLADGYKIVLYGSSADKLLVLSRKESQLDDFKKVHNKRLSLLANEPISKLYAELLSLKNFGKKISQIFNKINYVKNSNLLIYQLFFKDTDIIFVYQAAYNIAKELNPQIGLQTQIIASLSDIPRGLGYFHRREDPVFREKVLSEVEKLGEHIRGQQLLALFSADKIKRSTILDLKTTQQLMQDYQRYAKP